jgi:hypothetical protein
MGRQVGDRIQCGYRVLCFDQYGAGVKNPVDNAPTPEVPRSMPILCWQLKVFSARRLDSALAP